MSAVEVTKLVEYFLRDENTAKFGPYEPIDGPDEPLAAEELIPDRLYRLQMWRKGVDNETDDLKRVDVQVFLGIGELGGLMWEQSIRALLRVAGSAHQSLPQVQDGGYVPEPDTRAAGVEVDGMAFVVTLGARITAGPTTIAHFREHKQDAFKQLRSLADGLAILNHLGITHRGLSPATIDVYPGTVLRLARFELSALVDDLFRSTVDTTAGVEGLRELFLRHHGGSLAYASPERLAFLLANDEITDLIENDRSDVYALAAVACEWFVGDFPDGVRPPVMTSVPTGDEAARIGETHRRFNEYLRTTLEADETVPVELTAILTAMLSPEPDDRPSADDVVGLLTAGFDRIMAAWDEPPDPRPHAMIFMPAQSAATVYQWGWIERHPTSDEGRRELAEFIKTDLRGAFMMHSAHGADPFVSGGDRDAKREAKVALRGARGVWFCHYYRPEDEHGQLGAPNDQALLIKYVARLDRPWVEREVRNLDWRDARSVPEVDLLPNTIDLDLLARRLRSRPSWRNLVGSLRPVEPLASKDLTYQKAIDWLIEYQDVELKARIYPYVLVGDEDGAEVGAEILVRYDETRDKDRLVSSPMLVRFAASPQLRPQFGAFFGSLEDDDGDTDVDVIEDRDGRPGSVPSATVTVLRQDGQDRVVLSGPRSGRIPRIGWMRPAEDRGSWSVLDRQRRARYELYGSRLLREQIRAPHTIRTLPHRWADAGRELSGDGPAAVREMLVCEPFAAIQGPPGTGKTRVAATALAAYLRDDPTARVLVSAQSNFALDNLATAVLHEIGALDADGQPVRDDHGHLRPIPLRVSTGRDSRSRVSPKIQPWTREGLAVRMVTDIRDHVDKLLADRTVRLPDGMPAVLETWRDLLGTDGMSAIPELSDRLHRGANLVFATCATSTPELLSPTRTAIFNWVVIEEAAKAWPTELAIPMVRGLRWTLLGDHFQLPAHRRKDLEQFLDSCVEDNQTDMAIGEQERTSYLEAFDLFGNLFRRRDHASTRQSPPLLRMTTQFRMREPIAEVISRVFYRADPQPQPPPADGLPAGGLSTFLDPEPDRRITPVRLDAPGDLDGESLVWLDTEGIPSCRAEPHWYNKGEADLVIELLQQLQPFPQANRDGYGESPLAVLTPYREQMNLLKGSSLAREHLSTVHAFQGREADIVIVSLVRDTVAATAPGRLKIQAGLGHVAQRELVNVLFSRARRQLVIVGRFNHFATAMGPKGFWTEVCRAVERHGTVLSAASVLGVSGNHQLTSGTQR